MIAGKVAGSTWCGKPASISVVSGTTSPRAGVPADDDADPEDDTSATAMPTRAAPTEDPDAWRPSPNASRAREPAQVVRR